MNKKKLNWWVVSAVLVLGIPVGFVITGIIDKTKSHVPKQEVLAEEVNADTSESIVQETEADSWQETVVEEEITTEPETSQPAPETAVVTPVKKPAELTPEQKEEMARKEAERKALAQQKAEEAALKKEEAARKKEEARLKAAEEQARKETERQAAVQLKAAEAQKAAEAKKAEEERKKQAAYDQLLSEVNKIVAAGNASSKVSDGCVVVVNGKNTTNYQDFRNGVKLGSYSGIKVSKIEGSGSVSKIYVAAKVNAAED